GPLPGGQSRERTAEVLATVRVEIAKKASKAERVADRSDNLGALRRIGPNLDDGGSDLRPRPEYRWSQPPHQRHVRQALYEHAQGAVCFRAGPRHQPFGNLPLDRHDHALDIEVREKEIRDDGRGNYVR